MHDRSPPERHDRRSPTCAISDHFDGTRFFNPDGAVRDKSWRDLCRFWSGRRTPWPARVDNLPHPPPPRGVARGETSLTFIGHVTFLVQADGVNLLTDPVFAERASPFRRSGPKRVRPPGLALEALPRVDLVLVSHNHYDHMDLRSLRRIEERWQPLFVTGLGNREVLRKAGLGRVEELDWWDEIRHGGLPIAFVPAQHWSRRALFDRNRTLWGGFVVRSAGCPGGLYFAGDTGYPGPFRALRERLGAPDLALLPIGAYEPRWFMQPQHMNPEEAVLAHRELGARLSIAMHFGTFRLTHEGFDAPVRDLAAALRRHRVTPETFRVMEVGETLAFDRRRLAERDAAHQTGSPG
jgi:L-ascorbate metabolism protein UlaG (beta-lactamase superfamily)